MSMALSRTPASQSSQLNAIKVAAAARINATIGERRREWVTDIPGQEMIYRGKLAEARAYQAELIEPLTLDDYPFIAAEVGVTAPDAAGVAAVWIAKGTVWTAIGADLEGMRHAALIAVTTATDAAGVAAAEATFEAAYSGWNPPV